MEVVGVRFRPASKVYYFDPGSITDLQEGDQVVVQTTRGIELGYVVMPSRQTLPDEFAHKLRPITRRATPHDRLQTEYFRTQEGVALQKCRDLVRQRNIAIKVVGAEYNFDGSRLTFLYQTHKKLKFNRLVEELKEMFNAEIELRTVGERDCAKYMGGIGYCGRSLCCETWLIDFAPVSIKKAKTQGLSLSPMDIAGACSRLLCCLNYESEFYDEVSKRIPRVGTRLSTPYGMGEIIEQNFLTESVQVRLDDTSVVDVSLVELERGEKAPREAKPPSSPPRPERERPEPQESPSPEQQSKSRRRRRRRRKPADKSAA